jgi:hemoglobin-like flavoprotein
MIVPEGLTSSVACHVIISRGHKEYVIKTSHYDIIHTYILYMFRSLYACSIAASLVHITIYIIICK